jgi:Na+-transporting methylmalonyl-CoA/oxaloacetate decarboxylase gamma subunit
MTEQDILVQEGMSLLYSGMAVVFSFLLLLIISVNLLRMFFAFIPQKDNVDRGDTGLFFASMPQNKNVARSEAGSLIPVGNKIHHRIIKEVLTGIRS